jgi:hypothetical protein
MHCGGRPWTFIIRDFSYENPMMVFFIGANIGLLLSNKWQWIWSIMILIGVIFGHLFWGRPWIKNERNAYYKEKFKE